MAQTERKTMCLSSSRVVVGVKNRRGCVSASGLFIISEIKSALKVASVLATESCFISTAVSYIISWSTEEWHVQQKQSHSTLNHSCHISQVGEKAGEELMFETLYCGKKKKVWRF